MCNLRGTKWSFASNEIHSSYCHSRRAASDYLIAKVKSFGQTTLIIFRRKMNNRAVCANAQRQPSSHGVSRMLTSGNGRIRSRLTKYEPTLLYAWWTIPCSVPYELTARKHRITYLIWALSLNRRNTGIRL